MTWKKINSSIRQTGHSMIKATRGARPIEDSTVSKWLDTHQFKDIDLDKYADTWRNWLTFTNMKSINGLENFPFVDYTQGTSQTFDNFVLKHNRHRQINWLVGDFQYHRCISKFAEYKEITTIHPDFMYGKDMHALIISAPFSDYGCMHPDFEILMDICMDFNIPVCLDLAYWGIAKNVHLDLDKYPCIKEVTCSLSKPFHTLENHRVGVRFTRDYADDGISMLNEVDMQNKYSMSLGVHYMKNFSPDYMWEKYGDTHYTVCTELDIFVTDTVIFGISQDDKDKEFNRGIDNNNRICISQYLKHRIRYDS